MELKPGAPNYPEIAKVALDLWRSFQGGNISPYHADPAAAQKNLLFYRECLRAVSGEAFDVTKIT